ncbi:MAG: ribonuclease P protein component [Bacteroidota bacterium]
MTNTSQKRFGLSKLERIKKKNEFSRVYSSGKTIYSNSRKLKAIFCLGEVESKKIKVAFAISKRAGNAVWRNRLRRLLRESYRLNKEILFGCNQSFLVVFSPNAFNKKETPKLYLKDVETDMISLLEKLRKNLT